MDKLTAIHKKIEASKAKIAAEQEKLVKLEKQRTLLERELILKASESHDARDVIALLTPEKPVEETAAELLGEAEGDAFSQEEMEGAE